MTRPSLACLSVAFSITLFAGVGECANVLHSIDVVTDHPSFSIVLIKTKSSVSSYKLNSTSQADGGVYVDLAGVTPGDRRQEMEIGRGALRRVRVDYDRSRQSTRIYVDLQPGVDAQSVVHRKVNWNGGGQIILLIDRPKGQLQHLVLEDEAKRFRDEGKKIVIIDPGHGWLDPGCQYYGMDEKTIVLDIGRKLAHLINQTDNMKAYLTRDGDYLPVMNKDDYSGAWNETKSNSLNARLDFARRMSGHVFVSLHLNYCPGRKRRAMARGFEIYCLGRDRSESEYKKQVNEMDGDIEPTDLLEFGAESQEESLDPDAYKFLMAVKRDLNTDATTIFVEHIKNRLLRVPGLVPRDPPIKTRGFRVLRTLAMPSALVELAFLTNPQDARLIKTTEFRWELAKSLYEGIAQYFADHSTDVLLASSFEPAQVSVPKENYDIHVVQSGENLFDIAQKYGTDASALQRINGKGRSTTIYPSEELKVPKVSSAPATQVYTVRTGDSLCEIAQRYGMTVAELMSINQLRNDVIQPGDKLRVSSQVTAQSPPPKKTRSSTTRVGAYKVRKGDTLFDIAREHHTSVSNLKRLNGIRSNNIQPGQSLRVPLR
ncbi:MAG: LysM peptidoglycan-binding domain-containing protein [bacterium]